MVDLTDLKELTSILNKMEDEAITVNALLQNVAGVTDGYFDWQVGSEDEYLSDNFKLQLGYNPEEMPNKAESWQKIIYQEDLDTIHSELNKHIETKGKHPFQVLCRYTHKDGSMVKILCRGKIIEWTENHEPVRFVGVHIKL